MTAGLSALCVFVIFVIMTMGMRLERSLDRASIRSGPNIGFITKAAAYLLHLPSKPKRYSL